MVVLDHACWPDSEDDGTFSTRRKLRGVSYGDTKMYELRKDVNGLESSTEQPVEVDDRVIAPTEPLDDRDSEDPDFRVDEEFSCTNTNFGRIE